MKILTLPTAESGIKFRVLPIITNGRSGEKMLDKNKLQNCRAASVSTCDVSELKDIRKIEIASAQPRANRAIGFLNQVGNPYLFKVGKTVVKVEYEGGRGFSEAFADLLCAS